MNKTHPFSLLAVMLLSAACGSSVTPSDTAGAGSNTSDNGPGAAPVPEAHRPAAEACPMDRPAGSAAPGSSGACSKDADCAADTNGRCVVGPDFIKSVCSYDECFVDSDCGSGACDCRNAASSGANKCFRGNCLTDADCGGQYCSPSATALFSNCLSKVPPGSFGYFCHTPEDECTDDADCTGAAGAGGDRCLFNPDALKWTCLTVVCTKG